MRLLHVATALAAALAVAAGNSDFVNQDVKTRVDVSKHVVKVTHALTVTGSSAKASKYVVALPTAMAQHVALVEAKENGATGSKFQVAHTPALSTDNTTAYTVQLGKAIGADTEVAFKIAFSLTHVLTPLPAVVQQAEQQYLVFDGLVHMLSPYPTLASKTEVRLASSKVRDYTDDEGVQPVSQEGTKVTYGPFADLPAWAAHPLHLHFASNAPFVTFTNVEREVEVSLWGNVAVEEFFTLKHTGAVLKDGLFSRVDYMKGAIGNSYRALAGRLPGGVRDVYYRDIIGNISTSNMRVGLDSTSLDIEARFPIFGGWGSEWYLGYNMPTEGVLTSDGEKYTLTMPLAIAFPNSVTDEFVLKVILPEGAADVAATTPLDLQQSDTFTRFTYLDAGVGRPVLELKGANIIKGHKGDLTVTFTIPPMTQLREPAMLVGTFLALFLAGSLLSRLQLGVDN